MARLLAFLCAFALSLGGGAALAQPEFPERGTAPVLDLANVIDDTDEALLTERLDAFEEANQRQFVVVTVPSLDGYDIADYGYQLGRAWGLGDAENDDGIILLVAPNERKVRIGTGLGIEDTYTDEWAAGVIDKTLLPRFRQGNYGRGLEGAVDMIIERMREFPTHQTNDNRPREAQEAA